MSGGIFLALGVYVGSRYFRFRDKRSDKINYVLYNV